MVLNMSKKSKIIIIIGIVVFVCVSLAIFFISSSNKLTNQEYDKKVVEYNIIFDRISKDFYQQAINVVTGNNPSVDLQSLYGNDLKQLNNIFLKYKESSVTKDRLEDFKYMKQVDNSIFAVALYSSNIKEIGDKKYWQTVKDYSEKRFAEIGMLDSQKTTAINSTKPNLELLDKTDVYENGTSYITGHIKNNSKFNYSSVSVNVSLFDDNGNRVGDAIDIINNLSSGDTWSFKAMAMPKFKQYRIADIHGY